MKKMSYHKFKAYVVDHIRDYLPEEYREYTIKEDLIPKTNGYLEAITITSNEPNQPAPILYCRDLYAAYQHSGSEEDAMQFAAEIFAYGMNYGKAMIRCIDIEPGKGSIIMTLVNPDFNRKLLAEVPHRKFMDLTIYYRHMMPLPDGTFNAATITNEEMKRLGMTEEELYANALENTPRLLPLWIIESEDNICVLTNEKGVIGASVMLYPGVLAERAELMESDLYIIPSSIHEVIVIPASQHSREQLLQMIHKANQEVVPKEEVLSDTLYYYSRADDAVMVAEASAAEAS